jgi:hypothetical protein
MVSAISRLIAGPDPAAAGLRPFADYESGKRRRYELLFAVNGGAYGLVTWAIDKLSAAEFGGLTLQHVAIGMAGFTAIMCLDLFAFGLGFAAYFGRPGRLVIVAMGTVLMAGWFLAGEVFAPRVAAPLAFAAAFGAAVLACVLVAEAPPRDGA